MAVVSFTEALAIRKAKAKTFSQIISEIETKKGGSLYVRRNLKNADQFHKWATDAGFKNVVPPSELHVTNVYSRAPVKLEKQEGEITAAGGARSIAPLGDKGAVVVHFQSPELSKRWDDANKAGASWDYPDGYKPHVTVSYDAGGMDISKIAPPDFPLVFGPEIHEPLNENWAEEKGLRKFTLNIPITKTQDDQCLVFGWASIIEEDGQEYQDTQGDVISESDLEAAFYGFAKDYGAGGEMHFRTDAGEMVECMVFTKEKQKTLGIDLKKVGAWVGFKVAPEVFAKVKSGEYPAFSIGGFGRREAA